MDGRFRRFESRDPDSPDRAPDRAGWRLPQAADASLNLGAVWHATVDGAAPQPALRYRCQSAMYFNIYRDPAVSQGGYGLWDASALLESRARRWYREVHGRNLSDRLYAQTIMRKDPLTGIKRHWGAPRTWGARLGQRW